MNLQLQRKQIFVLAFATALAVASYWIPTADEAIPTSSTHAAAQKAHT